MLAKQREGFSLAQLLAQLWGGSPAESAGGASSGSDGRGEGSAGRGAAAAVDTTMGAPLASPSHWLVP